MSVAPSAAEALYFRKICKISDRRWRHYAPAYVITNEVLKPDMQFMPKNCKKVLTVAASGDHPLFCKLYGAEHITTFDITYNAKIITDIKIAAIQELTCEQYWKLLKDLHKTKNPFAVPNMDKITPYLSENIKNYMYDMVANNFSLFSSGEFTDMYESSNFDANDLKKLKKLLNSPFDFIWSDAVNLQLTDSYDFIHLSNISDYLTLDENARVLTNMIQHTNVGGRILAQQQNKKNAELLITQVPQQLPNWEILSHGQINVLQRVR